MYSRNTLALSSKRSLTRLENTSSSEDVSPGFRPYKFPPGIHISFLTAKITSRICVRHKQLNWTGESGDTQNVPLEDISVVILENPQIQITSALLSSLAENGAVVFSCDASHLPNGAFFPFHNNSRYTETALAQINSSLPLRKRMWQEIIIQKIKNQSAVLRLCGNAAYKKLDMLAVQMGRSRFNDFMRLIAVANKALDNLG